MTRMVGTGKAPQGYMKDQVFDVPEHDQGTVEDLERKGWAKRLDPRDDVGHSKVSVANAMVRGDMISHPVDAEIAKEIGGHDAALPIVHTSDPDATSADYEQEAEAGHRDWDGNPLERQAYGHVAAAAQPQEQSGKKAPTASKKSAKTDAKAEAKDEPKADAKADDDKAKK